MVAVLVIATISFAACSADAADPPAASDPAPSTASTASPATSVEATATKGPGRGAGTFGGPDPQRPVTFTLPDGWEIDGGWVLRSDNYGRPQPDSTPPFGLVFLNVGNIYADGCRWQLVDPAPGPTVDDLVAAYADVPGFDGPARDVVVDGFSGKLVEFTVPNYNKDDCDDGVFGLFQEAHEPGTTPNVLAQAPRQRNQIRILDVAGTRLVIHASYPAGISAQDRSELDGLISSIDIG